MDEPAARVVILAQAIETADPDGKLLAAIERDQIDRQARQDAGVGGGDDRPVTPERFLRLRAQRVIAAVDVRHPVLAALQHRPSWERWAASLAPVLALVLGVLTDIAANPHRVDLLSLPLLGILGWNVAIYFVLIAGLFAQRGGQRLSSLAGLGRWTDGERALRRRAGNLRSNVVGLFYLGWFRATDALHVQRVKRVLHLSAAAWAIGVALSLLVRGLVVEYRVGWESTFLGASQVHAILSLLRLPALLLFPFQPFTVQEVAGLQFSHGGGAMAGARWVYMYVALLLVVVVVPRAVLAAVAYLRERMLARSVPLDLADPYYQRLVSLLHAARVQLCLVIHREEDGAALRKVLVQEPGAGRVLVKSAHDDVLLMAELPAGQVPPPAPAAAAGRAWIDRLRGAILPAANRQASVAADPRLAAARDESDVVLHLSGAPGDLEAAGPLLAWLGKPVLNIALTPDANEPASPERMEQRRVHARGLPGEVELPFGAFARSWVQERALLDAIARLVPEAKRAGFARIAAAWDERNATRLNRSMVAIAEHLLFAARQNQEAHGGALTVRNLIPAERQAQAQAKQQAMDAVVKRLDQSASEMFSRLRAIHCVDEAAANALQHHLEQKFVIQQPVDTPQAGMAGAATGAAMGASVDLLVGGLTLGAATALGALVGGSAAFIAAAWKNRATPGGSTLVQLSDEMLQALLEAALLRYLAMAHHGRNLGGNDEPGRYWKSEVVAAVDARKAMLAPFWTAARTQPDGGRLALGLGRELETISRTVLAALYQARATAARDAA